MSTATAPNTTPATQVPQKITTQVLSQIEKLKSGGLVLPSDYNVENAVQSAWLKLQTIQNKDQKPIIKNGQVDQSVVTLTSCANALHDYVIQGLNVAKNQAYFIVYGQALTCQRSYHGDMLVAARVNPGIAFAFDTIREGEKVTISKLATRRGPITTVNHEEIQFPRNPKIVGAYCGVYNADGECLGYTVMEMDRIKKSWSKSKTYQYSKPDKPTTHDEFPEEMALRTVIRHRCKSIISSSSDVLLLASVKRQDEDSIDAELDEAVAEHANAEVIALPIAESESVQEAVLVEEEQGKKEEGAPY